MVLARRPVMSWFRVQLTEEEQRIVAAERESHPESHVRRKMLALWSLHCGLKRFQAAQGAVGIDRHAFVRPAHQFEVRMMVGIDHPPGR